jgi:hypothetical protein
MQYLTAPKFGNTHLLDRRCAHTHDDASLPDQLRPAQWGNPERSARPLREATKGGSSASYPALGGSRQPANRLVQDLQPFPRLTRLQIGLRQQSRRKRRLSLRAGGAGGIQTLFCNGAARVKGSKLAHAPRMVVWQGPLFCPRSARAAAASWGQARTRRINL